jgi:hypothetical protein
MGVAAERQPGNIFPGCGPVIPVLPLLPDAARGSLLPFLDTRSVVSGGPEWAAGRVNIGGIVGFSDKEALHDLIADDGLPVHTAYEGKRFSNGVRMVAFASQLLEWLRQNHPRRLLELGIPSDLPW